MTAMGTATRRRWAIPVAEALAWPLAGAAVGVAWRLLTPLAAGWVESYEVALAGDVTLAVLDVVAGLLVGLVCVLRPGPGSARRFVVAVLGSTAGSGTAWGVGRLAGAPTLAMPSVLLLWPLAVAVLTVCTTLVATIVLRDPYDDFS